MNLYHQLSRSCGLQTQPDEAAADEEFVKSFHRLSPSAVRTLRQFRETAAYSTACERNNAQMRAAKDGEAIVLQALSYYS
jgi:hypothetical protein